MKKSELVNILKGYPDDIEVFVNDSEYGYGELGYIWVDDDKIILSETPPANIPSYKILKRRHNG